MTVIVMAWCVNSFCGLGAYFKTEQGRECWSWISYRCCSEFSLVRASSGEQKHDVRQKGSTNVHVGLQPVKIPGQ